MKTNNHQLAAKVTQSGYYSRILFAAVFAAISAFSFMGAGSALAQTPQIVEVRPGDSFASVAGPLAGGMSKWRKLYRPELSGLSDPNKVVAGMRFELVNDTSGQPYLRRVTARGTTTAKVTPAAAVPLALPAAAPQASTAAPAAVRPESRLIVGVLPNISSAVLTTQYEHLKRYLERVSGSKVTIVVPPNFKAMFDSTMNGEFDIAITAPHFARVAQLDRGFVPLGMYEPRISALFVAPIDTTITNARDARGKAIAFANPTSLVAMFGQQWLRSQNMEAGKDYEVRAARTDMGVGRMLLVGEAAGAVMSNGEFRSLPADESQRLKIVESFARIPNFVILANSRLGRERLSALRGLMRDFFDDKDDGAAFVSATGLRAIVEADETQLRELDTHTAATRQLMGVAK
jgi:phosphonate transport system substrate-binding protein